LFVETLQEIEHRAVVVFSQAARYVHDVVGRDTNEILVESSMMNGAEAKAVSDAGVAEVLDVAHDVCRIEQS
jgi:hypothetical protein